MTITYEQPPRSAAPTSMATLEDRFEVMKEIGDGSFGSVGVARVRTAGSNIARRGTMVGIGLNQSDSSMTQMADLAIIDRLQSRR